jgi:hypothetical protein
LHVHCGEGLRDLEIESLRVLTVVAQYYSIYLMTSKTSDVVVNKRED